ncbi:hypothetical protein SK128_005287, partial [Halocaridina rubra]
MTTNTRTINADNHSTEDNYCSNKCRNYSNTEQQHTMVTIKDSRVVAGREGG